MVLTLRPTRLEKSPAFRHLADYTVHKDGKPIGRIYEQHAPASPDQAWYWSITEHVDPVLGSVRSGRAASLEEAKEAFLANWSQRKGQTALVTSDG